MDKENSPNLNREYLAKTVSGYLARKEAGFNLKPKPFCFSKTTKRKQKSLPLDCSFYQIRLPLIVGTKI